MKNMKTTPRKKDTKIPNPSPKYKSNENPQKNEKSEEIRSP